MRKERTKTALVLVGLVLGLDLLWRLLVGSTGSVAYALVDEPAHLATAAIALAALAALASSRLSPRFILAALVSSIAIDIDHVPGYLGSPLLGGNMPRPDPHSLLVFAIPLVAAIFLRDRGSRDIALGIALGVSAHLLRDLSTGPGAPVFWPISDTAISFSYGIYAGALALGVATVMLADRRSAAAARTKGFNSKAGPVPTGRPSGS